MSAEAFYDERARDNKFLYCSQSNVYDDDDKIVISFYDEKKKCERERMR